MAVYKEKESSLISKMDRRFYDSRGSVLVLQLCPRCGGEGVGVCVCGGGGGGG